MVEEEAQHKIKDLIIKLQVLSEGLIEERKKSQSYLTRIKEYDALLISKDNDIQNLLKEKFDLQSKFDIERSRQVAPELTLKSVFNNLLKSKPSSDQDIIKQLTKEKAQLTFELSQLRKKVEDEIETYDQNKAKFQTLFTMQGERLKELEKLNGKLTSDNDDLKQMNYELNKERMSKMNEKETYDVKMNIYKEQNESLKEKVNELILSLENKSNELYAKEGEVNDLKAQLALLASKMTATVMKTAGVNQVLVPQTFKVQMIGQFFTNTEITIVFSPNAKKNIYEVVICEEGKEDRVNMLDVDYFKKNEQYANRVDICYMINGSQKKITIEVEIGLIEKFMQTYKEYFQKANDFTLV